MVMKKLAVLLLTIVMTAVFFFAGVVGLAWQGESAPGFFDVPDEHWAFDEIANLVERGIIAGYEDGSFKPGNTITRAEWAKIMTGAAELPLNDLGVHFHDIAGHWAIPYINAVKDYLEPYADSGYWPDKAALREEVTVSMVMLMGYDVSEADYTYLERFTDLDSISEEAKAYIAIAVEKELIQGFDDNTFKGEDTLTRAQAAVILWRAFPTGSGTTVPTSAVLPSNGGSVRVNRETLFSFVPASSGRWELYTSENGDSDPYLAVYDQLGEIIAYDDDSAGSYNARVVAYLDAGIRYTIRAGFFENATGSYTLYIAPAGTHASIPSGGGDVQVIGTKEFEFKPNRSGIWVITASDYSFGDSYIYLLDHRGNEINYNVGGYSAVMIAYLEAGETYYIRAGMYFGYYGGMVARYSLNVAPMATIEAIPGGGGKIKVSGTGFYEFCPDRTGLWVFTA